MRDRPTDDDHDGERAFALLEEGIGRRDLLRVAAGLGAGAIVPAWSAVPGATDALAQVPGRGPRVLQPGTGRRRGRYLASTPDTVMWGFLPNRRSKPVLRVRSGAVVTIDTVSHEGVLEDQGRDPVAYFGSHGVAPDGVLRDAIAIAASRLEHDFDDGPHVVTGPVEVTGARPGDVLRIDVLALTPRAPYGVISSRHGKGALPGEYPLGPGPDPQASAARPELYRNVSTFTPVRRIRGTDRAVLPVSDRLQAQFPIDPFVGLMGVARDTTEPVGSVPPTTAGGNIDIRDLTVGSSLYLPVFVDGAKFFAGDPHFAQGDGEVALTALEAPLRATFRLSVLPKGSDAVPGGRGTLDGPFGETADHWIAVGINEDLDRAMRQAVRESILFLHGELGMDRATAYAYLSAATDYVVSQVVDGNKGVHARIAKAHFVRA